MKLSSLVEALEQAGFETQWADSATPQEVDITGITFDSRTVKPDDLFVAIKGFESDGHLYAAQSAQSGASAILAQHAIEGVNLPTLIVDDTLAALAPLGSTFYDHPDRALEIVGVTGTNGKTTTCYLIEHIMREAGRKTGLIGTVEIRVGEESRVAHRTTPQSSEIMAILDEMRRDNVDTVAMEVSSHALALHRVDGIDFDVAAFTNLSQDHLDFHESMEEYYTTKKRLFTEYNARTRVVAIDTKMGARLAQELEETGSVMTVGRTSAASVRSSEEDFHGRGINFTLVTPEGSAPVRLPLIGTYNIDNALVAAGCALALNVPLATVASALNTVPQVPGRLERIVSGQPFEVVVDYAHTPDALAKAITALRSVTPGKVIVVFGCGGDRDPEKRPLMGRVVGQNADIALATSDNPRTEDSVAILLQVRDGLKKTDGHYSLEVDRRHAIERACRMAGPGDCVLIAGKGHEDYQIFAHHTIHFDDREVARESLEKLGYRASRA